MRRFVLFLVVGLAVLIIPVTSFVLAQSEPPQGETTTICHVDDPTAGTGKIISIATNAPALNAHKTLHGDCEDYDVIDEEAGTCQCEIITTGGGDDDGDDDDGGDDGGDDDDDGDDGDDDGDDDDGDGDDDDGDGDDDDDDDDDDGDDDDDDGDDI